MKTISTNYFDDKLRELVMDPRIALQSVSLSMKIKTMDGYNYTYLTSVVTALNEDRTPIDRKVIIEHCEEEASALWESFQNVLSSEQFISLYTEKMFVNKNDIKQAWIDINTEYLCSNGHPGATYTARDL